MLYLITTATHAFLVTADGWRRLSAKWEGTGITYLVQTFTDPDAALDAYNEAELLRRFVA